MALLLSAEVLRTNFIRRMKMLSKLLLTISCLAPLTLAYAADGDPKVPASLESRVYLLDTSSYDVMNAVGKLGVVDKDRNIVTAYIDKAHFKCDPSEAAKSKVNQMPNARVYYFLMDNKTKGSLSIFTLSANLSDEQRHEVMVDDISSVDLDPKCQIDAQYLGGLLNKIPTASGQRVFYVTGATMSHLSKQTYSSQEAGGSLSAGSWLSISGKYYKGSQQIDSVPVTSLRGYYIDVPKKIMAEALQDVISGAVPLVHFSTLKDLGLTEEKTTLGIQATPIE